MYLQPQLGAYRKALVTLLMAHFIPTASQQLRFAGECLELMNTIRQNNGGTLDDDDDLKSIQSIAEDFIEARKEKPYEELTQTSPPEDVNGPDKVMVEAESLSENFSEAHEGGKSTGRDDEEAEAGKDKCKDNIISTYRSDPRDKVKVDSTSEHIVAIEGMLRDGTLTYTPQAKEVAAFQGKQTGPI